MHSWAGILESFDSICYNVEYTIRIGGKGGTALSLYYTKYNSPLGDILLMANDDALIRLCLPGQTVEEDLLARAVCHDRAPLLVEGCDWLDRYFCGKRPTPQEIRLDPPGSDFRKQVWERLCHIPYGTLVTYGDIAREMAQEKGKNMSAQAVGGAVGHNPISLIIPCHRVVGRDGSLVGYNGGVALKRRLLKYEGVDVRNLYDPKPRTGPGALQENDEK